MRLKSNEDGFSGGNATTWGVIISGGRKTEREWKHTYMPDSRLNLFVLAPISWPQCRSCSATVREMKPRNTIHSNLSVFQSVQNILNHENMEGIRDVLTEAPPGSFVTSWGLTCSTGLMHACEGVIKSFRSVKVCPTKL